MPGIDEKENVYRVRQVEPSAFDENTFRTIDITKGVKAVVGKKKGESKMTIQTLLFYKDEFKTEDEVRAWIKSHDNFHAEHRQVNMYAFGSGDMIKKGKSFVKEVARCGVFTDAHGSEVEITEDMIDEMVATFGQFGKVFVPIGHPQREEQEDGFYYDYDKTLEKNKGWVDRVWREGGSMFAEFRITDTDMADKITEGSVADNSIGVVMIDGKLVLEHIALTLIPAITGLSDFEPVPVEFGKKQLAYAMLFSRKITEEATDMADDTKVIELEKAAADLKKQVEAIDLEKKSMADTLEKSRLELEKATKELAEFKDKELVALVEKFELENKFKPSQKEAAIALMKSNRADFEKFLAENVALPIAPKVEAKPAESVLETITTAEFANRVKEVGKKPAEYKALLEKIQTGKIVVIK